MSSAEEPKSFLAIIFSFQPVPGYINIYSERYKRYIFLADIIQDVSPEAAAAEAIRLFWEKNMPIHRRKTDALSRDSYPQKKCLPDHLYINTGIIHDKEIDAKWQEVLDLMKGFRSMERFFKTILKS